MPRALRVTQPGTLHHITCKGNAGQALFIDDADYQKYLELLDQARRDFPLQVFNFVLMKSHIQLLVSPREEGSLSKVMQRVTKEYAKYFNKKYERTGHLFQGRFKSILVQEEKYLFACSRYIDFDPVNQKMEKEPQQYKWSGHACLACGHKGVFKLDEHLLYKNLSANVKERQIAYRAMILHHQGEDLDLLNRQARVLGDKEFKKRFKK